MFLPESMNPDVQLTFFQRLFSDEGLLKNTGYSIFINLTGYLQALAIAIPIGFIVGLIPFFRHLISKQIEAIRFTPLPATTGIFMAIFGTGLGVKVEFLAFGIFVYLLLSFLLLSLLLQLTSAKSMQELMPKPSL